MIERVKSKSLPNASGSDISDVQSIRQAGAKSADFVRSGRRSPNRLSS